MNQEIKTGSSFKHKPLTVTESVKKRHFNISQTHDVRIKSPLFLIGIFTAAFLKVSQLHLYGRFCTDIEPCPASCTNPRLIITTIKIAGHLTSYQT